MFDSIPWISLLGGMLLGVSALLLMLVNGKTAGISGVVNGLITPTKGNVQWRLLFVGGMVLGGALAMTQFEIAAPDFAQIPFAALVVGGLLVGFGTRVANGCTSGHGICGIGRLSKRSILATLVFMLTAAITVYLRLH
ncbi:YeeE/YedE family protein [Vibrio ouci]|uniref:YeeE/YedE family protein n=1 Tax=Vibrio ouci TaxID=2499078 RepID=A0A4Y8W9S1_9VIBR|nr:YeeE/YedE thiosulfate transporter family protein [Vibrio ouci]TFH89669.1 YeeE/YedE family protein [Vibrio ouci]